jgi:hypothetical protein
MRLGERKQVFYLAWPSMRALVIAMAIATALIDGAPIPTPRVMQHLPPWLQAASLRLYDVQGLLLAPFRPIKETFGINQRWALFSSTGPSRHRMWVEARTVGRSAGGESAANQTEPWTLLYRALDDEHTFLADTLEFRRVRNTWNRNRRGAKPLYPAFAAWTARQIFLERPNFDEARVSMERVTVLDHGEGYQSTGEFDDVIVHRRAEVLR